MERILGKNISIREVEIDDAHFILELRQKRGKYLSPVSPSLDKQIDWIKNYKERKKDAREYYFIIENEYLVPAGTVRIYNINKAESSFSFGSFIIDSDKIKKYASLESMTMIFDYAFNELGLKTCFFDCRKNNFHANQFYSRYGANVLGEDDIDIFYSYDADHFNNSKQKKKVYDIINNWC
jgi:RimJ/RimL family protein N-acetyltransferase